MKNLLLTLVVASLCAGGAFQLGKLTVDAGRGDGKPQGGVPELAAQGRGPVRRPTPKPKKKTETPLVYDSGSGGAQSANGYIAVTGSYGVGSSVLYLIDTQTKQLSVYEARGGTQSMRRVVWVGARRIDRDLEVLGYNDESQYSHQELETMFSRQNKRAAKKGVSVPRRTGARKDG